MKFPCLWSFVISYMYYIKPNNAMKICLFQVSAANKNLKQDAQTQVAAPMQVMYVLLMTKLETLPQQ